VTNVINPRVHLFVLALYVVMVPVVLSKALFALFSVAVGLEDYRKGEVPRVVFVAAFPILFALGAVGGRFRLLESMAGLLAGLLVFLLAFFVSSGKLGLADVWYSGLSGFVLGPLGWYGAVCLACALALAALLVCGRRRVPFIPFMAAGSIVVIIFTGGQ